MKRVAVLRGGPSDEYAVSMQSGAAVLAALEKLEYPTKDIVITKEGEWLEEGKIREPNLALDAIDVVFVGLHGQYGEDGRVQRILQNKALPFTGSKALSSAIAFNKELTKRTLKTHGILMPRHRVMLRDEIETLDLEAENIFNEIGDELFVKPLTNGSSIGAKHIPNQETLKTVLTELLNTYDKVMIEEFIRGKEATVAVLDNFRNEKNYSLPAIEIVPPNGEPMFSNENKYNGLSQEIVPGRFSYTEKDLLSKIAVKVHKIIDCDDYSRSDFIVKDGQVYFLEVNTLPGLTEESLFPKAAAAVGLEFPYLIKHLVEKAK